MVTPVETGVSQRSTRSLLFHFLPTGVPEGPVQEPLINRLKSSRKWYGQLQAASPSGSATSSRWPDSPSSFPGDDLE